MLKRITPRMAYERVAEKSSEDCFRKDMMFEPQNTITDVINELATERKGENWSGIYDESSTLVAKTQALVDKGIYGTITSKLRATERFYRLKIEEVNSGELLAEVTEDARGLALRGMYFKVDELANVISKVERALRDGYRVGAWGLGEMA